MIKDELKDIYLETVKKAVLHSLYEENFTIIRKPDNFDKSLKHVLKNLIISFLNKNKLGLIKYKNRDEEEILDGKGWPTFALSMIGQKRLDNIQFCAENIIKNNIEGDFIEAGVWRGGAAIFMKAILKTYGVEKKVFVADSFDGLPKPDTDNYPADKGDEEYKWDYLRISLEQVIESFKRFNLFDDKVIFLKGWFRDTLKTEKINKLALVRLDGDMYESTWDGLISLYPKLENGGFLIIDDYWNNESCRKAVNDYFLDNNITKQIVKIDWTGAYVQK